MTLKSILGEGGYEVGVAGDVRQAREMLAAKAYDVVLTDLVLPGESGMVLVKEVRQKFPRIPVILMAGAPSKETTMEASRAGVVACLTKPVPPKKLLPAVHQAVTVRVPDAEGHPFA
ncbi:MAG: response regulator [Verrucomicrobiae bacterium]|nr:response regulator [Verrucomicrobiae bacterium]MCP5522967.1 response regulator [Verrucomicrobiales bacterium]